MSNMAIFRKGADQLTFAYILVFWLAEIKPRLPTTNRLAMIRDHVNPELPEIAFNMMTYLNQRHDYASKSSTNNASLYS